MQDEVKRTITHRSYPLFRAETGVFSHLDHFEGIRRGLELIGEGLIRRDLRYAWGPRDD